MIMNDFCHMSSFGEIKLITTGGGGSVVEGGHHVRGQLYGPVAVGEGEG